MRRNFLGLCRIATLIALSVATAARAQSVEHNDHLTYPCITAETPGVVPAATNQLCGKILRREDPANPDSPLLEIHYLKIPAATSANEPPLLFIQGGPGGASLALAGHVRWALRTLNMHRDFVMVDLRGTGQSSPVQCENLSLSSFTPGADEQIGAALDSCMQSLRSRAAFFTTAHSVNDLEAVRAALGYQQWAIWSVSYGGRVALDYMQRYPAAVAAVVLDSPGPATIALPSQLAVALGEGLQQLARDCLADEWCGNAYGDVWQKAQQLAARLEKKPESFSFTPPGGARAQVYEMTAGNFVNSLNAFFYGRLLYSQLAEAIARAHAGDWTVFISVDEMLRHSDVAMGLHFLVVCNEDRKLWPSGTWPTLLGQDTGHYYRRACAQLPAPQVADASSPIGSDIPALILSGGKDVVTPTSVAKGLQQALVRAQMIEIPKATHAVSFEGCIPELITQFLNKPEAPLDSKGCQMRIAAKPLFKGALDPSATLPAIDASAGAKSHD